MSDAVHPALGRTPAIQLFRLLVALGMRMRTRMDRRLAEIGLTTQQATVLTLVESAAEPPSLGEVARQIGTSHQNVRQLVDALARKGLVEVLPDARDRRTRRLRSTAELSRLFEAREPEDQAAILRWLGALSEPEMEVAVGLLLRVALDPRPEEEEGDRHVEAEGSSSP